MPRSFGGCLRRWRCRGGRYAKDVEEFVKKLDELRESRKPFFDDTGVMPWDDRLALALQTLHRAESPEQMRVGNAVGEKLSCASCVEETAEPCVLEGRRCGARM